MIKQLLSLVLLTVVLVVIATAAPPLVLSPELLEENLPAAEKKEVLPVDNGACYVCHGNYEEESLVLTHARKEVSCIDCHGKSEDHRNDEDNITPPDTMYDSADIEVMCQKCHKTHDASAGKVIQLWQQRCPTRTNPQQLVCTDCHFEHRLPFRTVRWDKQTGDVIAREKAPPAKSAE